MHPTVVSSSLIMPARYTVEVLAFCFACAGAMLLIVGGLTTVEEDAVQFVHDALPAHVSMHLAVVGVLLLLSAGVAWGAAFTASVNMCLVGMIGTLGGTALLWGSMLVFPARLTLDHWRAATALGRDYLFADDALTKAGGAKSQQQTCRTRRWCRGGGHGARRQRRRLRWRP